MEERSNKKEASPMEEIETMEALEIMIFMIIRNNTVLPTGLRKGKTGKEINQMAYETVKYMFEGNLLDWDKARADFEEGAEGNDPIDYLRKYKPPKEKR